jgi:hypothetical protein
MMGDFNARVGNYPVTGCTGSDGEPVTNNNGILLKDFCTFNNLKISNTFFRHKNIHKYTWEARGTKSIIDYIIINNINNKLNDDIKGTRNKVWAGFIWLRIGTDQWRALVNTEMKLWLP